MPRIIKTRRLIDDAFWALLGQVLSACALLIGTRILTELVSPAVYGEVALLNGFVALGVALFSYPFICAGMRLLPECQQQEEKSALYGIVSDLVSRSTALAIGLLALAGGIYRYISHIDLVPLLLLGVLLVVTVRRELGIQLLIGERKHRSASLWQTGDSILRPLMAIALVLWGGAKPEWILLAYVLASLLSNMVWSFFHYPKAVSNSGRLERHLKNEIWAYALPLIPMELIFWLNGIGDRYIIGYYMTAADVGLYAATYLIINEAFNRSAMVLLRTFQPAYFQACSQNESKDGYRILWTWIGYVIGMGVAGVGLLFLTKDWVALLLLAKTYHSAVALMPAIAIGCSLHALGTVLAQPLLAKKKTRFLLLGRISGVLTAAISIPLLVMHYGLLGAAFANPIYFGVEALVLTALAKPWQRHESANAEMGTGNVSVPNWEQVIE